MKTYSIRVFNRFERFWHWSQMLLIMLLLLTGFNIRGLYSILPFGLAVNVHTVAAILLLVLWVFATFWHFTTGTWKQYIPSTDTKSLIKMMKFYAFDIFKGTTHPHKKSYWCKYNPLQVIVYLTLKIFLFPMIWISGLAYLTYNMWAQSGSDILLSVAWVHIAAAFSIAMFIVIHVYLLTTGHSMIEHIKPMITGFDDVELTEKEVAYLQEDEPNRIKHS